MTHIWVRAEQRPFEQRVGVTPEGVAALMDAGFDVTVETSDARAIPIQGFKATGCTIAQAGDWMNAPDDVIVFGLKELDPDGPDLRHRHIMFGHAFKGQADGPDLLNRFKRGGGALYDLEYLVDDAGRRVAAFGYWAGFAGAAAGLMALAAQHNGHDLGSVGVFDGKDALLDDLRGRMTDVPDTPRAIVIGAKGRVGTGASDLCDAVGIPVTKWDIEETKHGGPFPQIMQHTMFVNCILAGPDVPVFVPKSSVDAPRALRVVADVSCDPNSSYNPVPIYTHSTTFEQPLVHVADNPPLDVMAIDNLPSMLPVESSADYAAQLLPVLLQLDHMDQGVWGRAYETFQTHLNRL
ncbi:saccharopine dehydrogenase [Nereida sp. MMG025]|uniref:saccharopine dehydrogenase n=1 Tax=Nereida sp. MMG025 TaxID=2909981 RepID=UPI001F4543E7|nr:saccharopine dehydrogenase [Nereida sp. MMG025]MCF6444936.1 saccharopine dehydrogenase [Nereida sp. MMG025]